MAANVCNGRELLIVKVCDCSGTATCYAAVNDWFRPEAVIPALTVVLDSHAPGRAMVHEAGLLRGGNIKIRFATLVGG